ncbi:DUF1361 domain-containing protein [Paenibacillus sp. CMAA1739]|uniref:DUF1361 domain-containing protein n=1 Tax=Paenibacillus ottowii TaxID=2315729 RepID=UPI0027318619|nr:MULTISPECIES: DUF1361 domain-containing protein [Paenibacillus]MDP1511126.1 DUF1361 domain-containing protein [Paenibacillus ottowii]MEC4566376.1 DUF1361 domain-containing protein [Paenibacillus sp. CMAA1739]
MLLRRKGYKLPGLLGVLLVATLGCFGLIMYLQSTSGTRMYQFLYWDIFLAWVPVFISLLMVALTKLRNAKAKNILLFFAAWVWLFFLPNALYLVTELLHAFRFYDVNPDTRFWLNTQFWLIVFTSFSAAGIGLFLTSLCVLVIHRMLRKICSGWLAWGIALVMLLLTSIGVYIGRFARLNSWDVLLQPLVLLADIWRWVIYAGDKLHLLSFSWLVFGMALIFYLFIYISLNED